MKSIAPQVKSLSLTFIFAILIIVFSAVTSPGQVLQYATFNPSEVVGKQTFRAGAGGSYSICCFSAEVDTSYWLGDTLMMTINTSGLPMFQAFSGAGASITTYVDTPGTYHLKVWEYYYPYFVGGYLAGVGLLTATLTVLPCDGCSAGDVDLDGELTVADVTLLAGYMFKSGFPPACDTDADTNGDSSHDVADLTYLVKYMFKDGDAPVCP